MTAGQLDDARAVREELELMFDAVSCAAAAEACLAIHCELSGVPHVNGDLCARLNAALAVLWQSIDAYDEFIATCVASSGDPAAGNVSPAAGEPLRAAA